MQQSNVFLLLLAFGAYVRYVEGTKLSNTVSVGLFCAVSAALQMWQ